MKILLRFLGDPRNEDQRRRYNTIEQRRADCWLSMYLARSQRARLYGLLPSVSLLRK